MEMWSICEWQNIFWRSRAQPSSSSEPGARVYVCEWYTCTCTTGPHVHVCHSHIQARAHVPHRASRGNACDRLLKNRQLS